MIGKCTQADLDDGMSTLAKESKVGYEYEMKEVIFFE